MRTVRAVRVEFDSSRKIREDQAELVVPAVLTRESILPFADGLGYRPAAELEAAAWTLEGAWVVAYSHIVTVFPMSREDVRGRVKDVSFDKEIRGVRGDIHFQKSLCDSGLLDGVRRGSLKDVSVAYFCEDVFEPGEFAGERYDFRQESFMFGHVAAGVPEGRCPSPFCGMNVDSFRPHFDPEVTDKYVRIRVRDPALFVERSFRTVVLSADQGIHAVVGKLKNDPSRNTVFQNCMFELAKGWTMEKAEAWIKGHKDEALQSTSQESDARDKQSSDTDTESADKESDKETDVSAEDRTICADVEKLEPFEVLEDSCRLLQALCSR